MEHELKLYLQTLDTVKSAKTVEELRSFCIQFLLMMASTDLTQSDFDWLIEYAFGPDTNQTMH